MKIVRMYYRRHLHRRSSAASASIHFVLRLVGMHAVEGLMADFAIDTISYLISVRYTPYIIIYHIIYRTYRQTRPLQSTSVTPRYCTSDLQANCTNGLQMTTV